MGSGKGDGGEVTIGTSGYEGKAANKPGEENGSTKKVDFLERGLGERRGGIRKGKSNKGMGKKKKIQ